MTPQKVSTLPKTNENIAQKKADGLERRRTKRMRLSFQIEISGHDRMGTPFRERAMTSDVNENGCKFDFIWNLKPGDLVSISVIPKGTKKLIEEQPTIFQVIWVEPSDLGWTVGATTLHYKNIWHMAFPTQK